MSNAELSPAPVAQIQLKGDGLAYDAGTGTITLPADPARSRIEALIDVPAQGAAPARRFLMAVAEVEIDRVAVTDFDRAAALGQMSFLSYAPPIWTAETGFARLIPDGGSRAHGHWAKAGGDGVYRCLLRWSGAQFAYRVDRRFSFGARVQKTGANWTGLRVDAYMTSTGAPRLQVRDYTGDQGATAVLANAEATWSYDAWHWLDVEIKGRSVAARIYPEAAPAPDWQIRAMTEQVGTGAFGPGGFPAGGQSPVIDVRRMEFTPDAG